MTKYQSTGYGLILVEADSPWIGEISTTERLQ